MKSRVYITNLVPGSPVAHDVTLSARPLKSHQFVDVNQLVNDPKHVPPEFFSFEES